MTRGLGLVLVLASRGSRGSLTPREAGGWENPERPDPGERRVRGPRSAPRLRGPRIPEKVRSGPNCGPAGESAPTSREQDWRPALGGLFRQLSPAAQAGEKVAVHAAGIAPGPRVAPRLCRAELATQNGAPRPPGRPSEADNGRQDPCGVELEGASGPRAPALSPAAQTGIERRLQRNRDSEKQHRRRPDAGLDSGERKEPLGAGVGWRGRLVAASSPRQMKKRKANSFSSERQEGSRAPCFPRPRKQVPKRPPTANRSRLPARNR
ncbi:translation initiation factor IF-2-like [Bubalus kerabau]|uniref:translation initiation factor IF-2-like n=1 Tax=Bubalus carabanensis TaxID=3119969 RepID=UPI00244EB7B8|nr:translation initiation factor IF-2-like [Bubalus carabanensis]